MVENDPAEVEKLRAIMERQIRQMSRLIDDLLDVSRITRGKIQLRRQPVDLNTIVEGAVEAVAPLIESCGHHLEVVTPSTPAMVDGDVARLTQIVGNLLNNAAKYTPREGKLRIAVERQGAEAIVRVTDNGAGIPVNMLESIFDMFQQVDQTLDRAHGGLGLGLTLVKRLVALHGGRGRRPQRRRGPRQRVCRAAAPARRATGRSSGSADRSAVSWCHATVCSSSTTSTLRRRHSP